MSRFFSTKYSRLVPYTPGEQPRDMKYVKLNTNENPFPPSKLAQEEAAKALSSLQLYSDPECRKLADCAAEILGADRDEILFVNGSDEALNFALMAYCDPGRPVAFADITYGFYPVIADLNNIMDGFIKVNRIPLKDDFTIDVNDYIGLNQTIFIANPNAPTGIALAPSEIERIVRGNPDSIVLVDEAYVDFGAESCRDMIHRYDNLLVCQTFSKSRSLAGARLGFVLGSRELIRDLNTIKYSTNPYNINSVTMAAGIGALKDREYFEANCRTIAETRAYTTERLRAMGFTVLDSKANFIFARSGRIGGEELYLGLKERGVLIRHFSDSRICDFNRITIGSREQMDIFLEKTEQILEGR